MYVREIVQLGLKQRKTRSRPGRGRPLFCITIKNTAEAPASTIFFA